MYIEKQKLIIDERFMQKIKIVSNLGRREEAYRKETEIYFITTIQKPKNTNNA